MNYKKDTTDKLFSCIDLDTLNKQSDHWKRTYSGTKDMFGQESSYSGQEAVRLFKKYKVNKILELGCGQGRDTIFFAQKGFQVCALDYCNRGLESIIEQTESLGLQKSIKTTCHDIRYTLPFKDESFDACYSHMFFCMALTNSELRFIFDEIRRVLKPGGLNMYTVRHVGDSQYKTGKHQGENMYEIEGGFIVHFFSEDMVKRFAKGYEILGTNYFQEGALPKELFIVTLRKTINPALI